MCALQILILCSILISSSSPADVINNKTFPNDFMFGAATASYQVEGAWHYTDKGENIWDTLTHKTKLVKNHDTGDTACDSFNKYKEDVALLKSLGVHHYRFSLSWSRILPDGFSNKISQTGVTYYKNLIKELKENGIEPLVTIYHWDLPQSLQDAGGWCSDRIIDGYADYVRICFTQFGRSVKYWTTFNEAKQVCQQGYGSAKKAPAISSPGIGEYLCAHNLLRAHAKAWHIYNDEFRSTQNGSVGIVIDSNWWEPASNSSEDEEAAETKRQFTFGWYANPIFYGDYPKVMKTKIANRSLHQGFTKSRLPEFTSEEKKYIAGTIDILGLNMYSSSLVKAIPEPDYETRGWEEDSEVEVFEPDDWPRSASDWLRVTPWGMRKILKWIKDTYKNPNIIITENGYSDHNGTLDDDYRSDYIRDYLSNIRDAMEKDKVNVVGYTVWSLLDNFEWMNGYTEKFGLYQVDFNSPNRTRTEKKSAAYYRNVIKTKCLVDKCPT